MMLRPWFQLRLLLVVVALVVAACTSSDDSEPPAPPAEAAPAAEDPSDRAPAAFGAAEVRLNQGDLAQGWGPVDAHDVTCSEPILASLESATSVARSYSTEAFTDGAGAVVASDAFVYLDSAAAQAAWEAVSSPLYADCLIAESRRQADAVGEQLRAPRVVPSDIADEEGIAVLRLAYPPAAGSTDSRTVDRVWLVRGSALIALRFSGESAPFDRALADQLISRVASRADRAAVTRATLQQPSPSQPPAESTASRARGSLVDDVDLPLGWVKAASADPAGSICSNELLRELGAKPLVVYGDPYVRETGPDAGLVDSIVYMFSTEHEARWGLERLASEAYLACVAARDGRLGDDDRIAVRPLPEPGFGDRSRLSELARGNGDDAHVLARKIWIQEGTLIGGIGVILGDDAGDGELVYTVAEQMSGRLAPASSG